MADKCCISEMMLVQNQMKEELERQDSLIVGLTNEHWVHSSEARAEIADIKLRLITEYKTKIDELSNLVSMMRNQTISMEMRLTLVEEELNRYKNL